MTTKDLKTISILAKLNLAMYAIDAAMLEAEIRILEDKIQISKILDLCRTGK